MKAKWPSSRILIALGWVAITLAASSGVHYLLAERGPVTLMPALVYAPRALPGVTVTPNAPVSRINRRARPGEMVSVELTAYCLRGTTRRGRWVRPGIVAADPKIFPLSRYVEVFIDGRYEGRFLVDDTGRLIRGAILDVWKPTCREARLFGRKKGVAVLVAR
jgi:3D (Asp-Asp-Asp) domain-containing protein